MRRHAVSQGQYVSQREKELESRDVESLSPEELGEMYTLQIKSAAQEVAVRDRHLEILKQNVDEARVAALEQHEEAVALGTRSPTLHRNNSLHACRQRAS